MKDPLRDVMEERARQDEKWGVQNHDDYRWLAILMEEIGELSKAMLEKRPDDIRKELVHATAVGLAWLECLERGKIDVRNIDIYDLKLSVRTRKCLYRLRVDTVGQLIEKYSYEILAQPNAGRFTLKEIEHKLAEMGLKLKGPKT